MSAKETGPRLGRGLAALIGDVAPATPEPAAKPRAIGVDLLEPSPFQPRGPIAAEGLEELVISLRRHGVLQPLLVRPHPSQPGRFQIIAGERRWRAAQLASLSEVPVLVRDLADREAAGAALVENLQRQDLDPIEEAEGLQRLSRSFGAGQEQLAEAVGKSRSHVANTLRLLNLPDKVRAHVKAGKLTAGHARALLAHPDPEAAAEVVIARELNVRQTEALASQPARAARAEGAAKDPETGALERDLSERLGLSVEISHGSKGGAVRIRYQTLDQLDGLIALLNRA